MTKITTSKAERLASNHENIFASHILGKELISLIHEYTEREEREQWQESEQSENHPRWQSEEDAEGRLPTRTHTGPHRSCKWPLHGSESCFLTHDILTPISSPPSWTKTTEIPHSGRAPLSWQYPMQSWPSLLSFLRESSSSRSIPMRRPSQASLRGRCLGPWVVSPSELQQAQCI